MAEPRRVHRVGFSMGEFANGRRGLTSRLVGLGAIDAVAFLLVLGALPFLPVGMLTRHMIAHIAVMSLVAPLAAYIIKAGHLMSASQTALMSRALLILTVLQAAVFAVLHTPALHSAMMSVPFVGAVSLGTLLIVSTLFWLSVLCASEDDVAGPVAALLVSGKLFCLVAVLMVFARRSLYGAGMIDVADQHAAGLIMLIACPMTYVGASVVIVARWLSRLSQTP